LISLSPLLCFKSAVAKTSSSFNFSTPTWNKSQSIRVKRSRLDYLQGVCNTNPADFRNLLEKVLDLKKRWIFEIILRMAEVTGEPGRMSALVHNPTIAVRIGSAMMRLAHYEG
jgi:hypothetical protein